MPSDRSLSVSSASLIHQMKFLLKAVHRVDNKDSILKHLYEQENYQANFEKGVRKATKKLKKCSLTNRLSS